MAPSVSLCVRLLALAAAATDVVGVNIPASFPHNYPGIPNTQTNFSDSSAWQQYFEVKDALPNITFPLTRSYAGNLPVNRTGHPNNTLFFWGFEKTTGSLTARDSKEPWVIWLNGGPGASSMLGLLLENGPIHFNANFTAFGNKFSWNHAADTFWVDQPVGTGWSTSDADAYVPDEDQMGLDFFGFLSNLVQVFPALATRPLFLAGESYAGVYIPYIAKTYFSLAAPPVSLTKIAIGDGAYASDETDVLSAVPSVLETYPQLIGYDTDVLTYFKEQSRLCGYDVNLTYPQNGIIPKIVPLASTIVGSPGGRRSELYTGIYHRRTVFKRTLARAERAMKAQDMTMNADIAVRPWKRGLSGRANGTIDPWYGCDTFTEMVDYALNFSAPWVGNGYNGFDPYFIPDALEPEAPPTPVSVGVFLNDPRVVKAIHAPTSKNWTWFAPYSFGGNFQGDPSPAPMNFFSELASNFSAHGIHWLLYSGNADLVLPHFGTEVVIQNTTFGGIQGFTQRPSTPFFDQEGNFAGKIHQERNLTFALFVNAGHNVPTYKPIAAFTFLKEFILGNNTLGSVLANGTVVGGVNATLAHSIMPAEHDPIFFGSGATVGSTVYPSATIAAWNSFIATASASATGEVTPTASADTSTRSTEIPTPKSISNHATGIARGRTLLDAAWVTLVYGMFALFC